MSIANQSIFGKAKIIPFCTTPPKFRRCITGLINSFAQGRISRTAMNQYLAEILPAGVPVDCGVFEVRLNRCLGDEVNPVIVFSGKVNSPTGHCPVCGQRDHRYLVGGARLVSVWCMNCSCVFSIPKEVYCS